MRRALFSCLVAASVWTNASASENILNLYTWSGVIPEFAIQQFEKETGIKVNFSTYDSNEILYAKLKASEDAGYDIVEPSSYYVDRMRKQNMLEPLDKSKLPGLKNIDPQFLDQSYDRHNKFSVPFIWGTTGIYVNKAYFAPKSLTKWSDLWDARFKNQLMLLDDSREVFAIALHTLGYSVNDENPEHIQAAYLKLKELLPNIKLFKSDGVITIMIDEDANIGMAWDGDLYKAKKENPELEYIFPSDGFLMFLDSFVMVKNPPHRENAYKFLNFMLRPDVAKAIVLSTSFATPNLAAQKLLPKEIQTNTTIYPSHAILRRGELQTDMSDESLALYEKYWEKLKMEG
jgi:spermidine/putrescine transport system substrate-binding protein